MTGLTVNLSSYQNNQESGSTSVKTNDQGIFEFKNVNIDPTYTYFVWLLYEGTEYDSDPITFQQGEVSKELKLVVYNTTTSDQDIQIALAHLIVFPGKEGGLIIAEYYLIANGGDKTFVGVEGADGKRTTLRFTVPSEAQDLRYTTGFVEGYAFRSGDTLSDTLAVIPGMQEVGFRYTLATDLPYKLSKKVFYPANSFDVLVSGETMTAESDTLSKAESLTVEGKQFLRLVAQKLPSQSVIPVTISSLAGTGVVGIGSLWLVIGLSAAAAVAILFLVNSKRRRRAAAAAQAANVPVETIEQEATESVETSAIMESIGQAAPEGEVASEEEEKLLAELAALDEQFDAGTLGEEEYSKLRTSKKKELVKLMQRKQGD